MIAVSPETEASGRDSWFNPGLTPATDRLRKVVAIVEGAVIGREYKRAPKPRERNSLHTVLTVLVTNLVQHYLHSAPGGIAVPRAKRALGAKPTRYEPFVFPKPFPKWLDALGTLGFITQRIGVYSGLPGQSKRTTVRAAARLIKLIEEHKVTLDDIHDDDAAEVIILSRSKRGYWDDDPKGRITRYDDTPDTLRFRSELRTINEWLAKADIQFDATGYRRYVDALPRTRAGHSRYPGQVDVNARKLRRRFTLGDFDFRSGGRLFGGFWEPLSKEARRRFIRIEGEAVTGLDYSQLNPLLCYHVAEAEPPARDAYTLPGLEEYRDSVKRVFNAMLFHHPAVHFPKRSQEEIKANKRLFPKDVKCRDVVTKIENLHPKLKGILSNGHIGHHLQYLESQIMIRVLLQCRERNIVALPVFDCVVAKHTTEATVREIMKRQFRAVTGLSIEVKRETPEMADEDQASARRTIAQLVKGRAHRLRILKEASEL